MPAYTSNIGDWVKVAIIAYVSIKVINFGLDKIGQPSFKV